MVNRDQRQRARALIDRYLACEISNDEYNDNFPVDENDPALEAIYCNLWPHYSDTHSHKAKGKHALDEDAKDLFRRCAVFLGTELQYEWPLHQWIGLKYLFMRLFGMGRRLEEQFEAFKRHGDYDVWPFIRREDWMKASEAAWRAF